LFSLIGVRQNERWPTPWILSKNNAFLGIYMKESVPLQFSNHSSIFEIIERGEDL
jgi:hypothetical protein